MTSTLPPDRDRPTFVGLAIGFELALAVLGYGVAWLGGVPLANLVRAEGQVPQALAWGLAATVPMLGVLVALLSCQWPPIVQLRRIVNRFVRSILHRAAWWQLAAVSIAAGVGEEVLFRGAIQPLTVAYTSPAIGLVVASLLFGLVHAASWSYFWLATAVGLYLGGLSLWREEILSAIVTHSLYDFLALMAIARGWFRRL